MRRRAQPRQVASLVTVMALFPTSLIAVDCSVGDSRFSTSSGDGFNITFTGFSSFDVQAAIDYWSGCPGYGFDIPILEFGGSGGIPVTITRVQGNSTSSAGACGLTRYPGTTTGGAIQSVEITVWTNESDGDSCDPLTDVIGHELGHALGLADAPDPSCIGHIMGARLAGGTRTVQGDDCEVADSMWETSPETYYDPYCDAYCWTSCVNNVCPDGRPDTGCPILIDIENDGVHLTGLEDPVWFDIDADGAPDLMSWTDRGEGLLALDRNSNGIIDSGGELFGNYTRLSDGSRALNGYLALADLDTWIGGGNGDAFLDASDEAFGSLRMWTDRNHDGISQPEELRTLEEAGLRRIALEYRRSNRTDRYGNTFRFLGRAWKEGGNGVVRPVVTWDVFFVVVP